MKIIIISNDKINKIDNDVSFYDMLTQEGLDDADKISELLKNKEKPEIIFSSPYISSLQSIYPYCIKNNLMINIDYALYPIVHSEEIYNLNIIERYYSYLGEIINYNYKSSILNNNIKEDETIFNINNRLKPFLYNISRNFKNTDAKIIFVVDNSILKLIEQYFNTLHSRCYNKTVKNNIVFFDTINLKKENQVNI